MNPVDITEPFPILEFDPSREAMIEPSRLLPKCDVPEHCVLCFFQDAIRELVARHQAKVIKTFRSEQGLTPMHELAWKGRRVAVAHPGIGAPFAAAFLEEAIAVGCRKFVACGGAGVLDKKLTAGNLIVPTAAVRDEGTSYHYLPPSRLVEANAAAVAAIEHTLKAHGCPYVAGKTWTTDAFYRETPGKVQRRRGEGCLTVEMEASAFFAVASFRNVALGQILYAGDDLSGPEWDSRDWHSRTGIRERVLELAIEACLKL